MDGLHHIGPDAPSLGKRSFGILYAEDFDEPDLRPPVPEPEPEPAPPTFGLAELEAAMATAARDAVHAARAEWEAGAAYARTQSLGRIAASVAAAQDGARLLAEDVAQETVRAILAVLSGLLPHLCRLHGESEVRALLRHLLPQLAQQPRVTVRVHPSVLDGVREELRRMDNDLVSGVTVAALDTLDRGDARVGWTSGTLRRDGNAIVGALRASLTELGLLDAEPAALRPSAHHDPSANHDRSLTLAE